MLSSMTSESGDIILKTIEERKIIFTRYQSPCNPESFAKRFFELSEILRQNKITGSRFFALFHDHHENFNYSSADIEVAAEIDKAIPDNRFFRIIGEQLYLTLVVKGPYCDLTTGYISIMNYAERYNLEKNGPRDRNLLYGFYQRNNHRKFHHRASGSRKKALTLPPGQRLKSE